MNNKEEIIKLSKRIFENRMKEEDIKYNDKWKVNKFLMLILKTDKDFAKSIFFTRKDINPSS